MKKSLLALAVLGAFAGAASAQSSVTIYGLVDQGINKGNGGTAPNAGGDGTSKAWTMKQSNASRLGFRGNEDLGGGLSAQFNIEHRFTPDDGQISTQADGSPVPFWNGRSYVQLSSATLGRVYLGREFSPVFWPAVKSDPFGWNGVGQVSGAQYAKYGSGPTSTIRTNNTIGYKSPSFSGLTVQAAVGLGEGTSPRANGFNVEYGAGPIYAALGYEKQKSGGPTVIVPGNSISSGADVGGNSLFNLAFHYDFGFVKPMLYYVRTKTADAAGNGGVLSNKGLTLGVLAPIGGGTLKAAYGRLSLDSAYASNGRETKFGLGYDYPLSKRTNLYADLSTARKSGTVGNVAGGTSFTNNNIYSLGVNHTF